MAEPLLVVVEGQIVEAYPVAIEELGRWVRERGLAPVRGAITDGGRPAIIYRRAERVDTDKVSTR